MNLLLTGGGTGGHLYPALAIAQALAGEAAAQPLEVLFVGSADRLEARLVPQNGQRIAFVASAPFDRKNFWALGATVVRNAIGVAQALRILHRFRPDFVVATGGYVAFPVVVAARLVRLLGLSAARIGLLEPNAEAGLTNRLLAPLADEVWLAYGDRDEPKRIVTGTPVRASFREPLDRSAACRTLGLDPALTTIVVFGGSQGARSIDAAVDALRADNDLSKDWQIYHVAGHGPASTHGRVTSVAYLDDPRTAYAAADLIVARSGASTLAEIAATQKPAILIPYPHATAGHQLRNAQAFAAGGAARILPDATLTAAGLKEELSAALEPATLARLAAAAHAPSRNDAGRTIAARILSLGARGSTAPLANQANP